MSYVGIETFDDLDRGMIDIRGDGTAYIYMSVEPYPENYKRKIIQHLPWGLTNDAISVVLTCDFPFLVCAALAFFSLLFFVFPVL